MLYTILLLTANFVGSLLLEMMMDTLAWLEIPILIFLGGLSLHISSLMANNKHGAWNILVAYHSLAIANLTLVFFVTGSWLWYVLLLLANLVGLLRAVNYEHHETRRVIHTRTSASKTSRDEMKNLNPHGISQSQVVDLPTNEPTAAVEPYGDQWNENDALDIPYSERFRSWEDPSNLESYDSKVPVIEPDTLYTSPFDNRIENGEARTDKAPELIVKLPTVAPKRRGRRARRTKTKDRVVKKSKPIRKTRMKKTAIRVVRTKSPTKRATLVKKSKKPTRKVRSSARKAKKIAPAVRVVRQPKATVVPEGEPIAAEPGRRRLILDL
ncbi:hypothetical protein HY641_01575 [Candidatus Woesearchaeota archaeon]|nr:hypothetical protein [Candidatus Woesearchaeota archaeon]